MQDYKGDGITEIDLSFQGLSDEYLEKMEEMESSDSLTDK